MQLEPQGTQEPRFRAVIKCRSRRVTEWIESKLDLCGRCAFNCVAKTSVTVKKDIIIVIGCRGSIMSVFLRLDRERIRYRLVKVKRIDKGVTWVQGLGWIKKPFFGVIK